MADNQKNSKNAPERPVREMLEKASGRLSAHMPGHKGRAPFGSCDLYALDTTELPNTDDFYAAENGIAEAEKLYAKAVGAEKTLFLHNGATVGIHAMLEMYANEGDTVLLPRNCHLSAINACVIGGLKPVWIPVGVAADGTRILPEKTVLNAIDSHSEAKVLLITRPDYDGCCLPVDKIIQAAHKKKMKVVVDEAHGAHLPWLPEKYRIQSAGELGADAWVQSVHKTLPGLTGCAVLNLRNADDEAAAIRVIRREQTSSPSFLMMMAIDDARAFMESEGKQRLAETAEAAAKARELLREKGIRCNRDLDPLGNRFDPTRLVVIAPGSGEALSERLRGLGLDVEKWEGRRVVLLLSCMNTPEEIGRMAALIVEACKNIPREALPAPEEMPPFSVPAMTPRKAVMAPGETVPLKKAVGKISAVAAGMYPPGIPLVTPGERINAETVARLMKAPKRSRFGTEDDGIRCVK